MLLSLSPLSLSLSLSLSLLREKSFELKMFQCFLRNFGSLVQEHRNRVLQIERARKSKRMKINHDGIQALELMKLSRWRLHFAIFNYCLCINGYARITYLAIQKIIFNIKKTILKNGDVILGIRF